MNQIRKVPNLALGVLLPAALALAPQGAVAENHKARHSDRNANPAPSTPLAPMRAILDAGRRAENTMQASQVEPSPIPGTRKCVSVKSTSDGCKHVTEEIVDDFGTVVSSAVTILTPAAPGERFDKHTVEEPVGTRGFKRVGETWKDSSGRVVFTRLFMQAPTGERFEFGMDGTGRTY